MLAGATTACSLFLDTAGIDDGKVDGAADVAATDASSDTVMTDAGSDAQPAKDASCPGTSGPVAIKAGTFCIDSTEVTNAQYQQFLDAIGQGYTPNKPAGCGGKTSFAPATANNGCTAQTFDPAGHASFPVPCVDWCDAWAYCAWAGKRLCGQVGGGAIAFDSNQVTSTASEWYSACSAGGLSLFPWGSNSPDDTRCNTTCSPKGDGGAIAVGTDTTCTTPSGMADMGGNQSEWVNSCGGTSPTDFCFFQGDSFSKKDVYCGECEAQDIPDRGYAGVEMGIRCCADAL